VQSPDGHLATISTTSKLGKSLEQFSNGVHANSAKALTDSSGDSALAALHPPPKQLSRFSLPLQDVASAPHGKIERSQVSSAPSQLFEGSSSLTTHDLEGAALGQHAINHLDPVAKSAEQEGLGELAQEQGDRDQGTDLQALPFDSSDSASLQDNREGSPVEDVVDQVPKGASTGLGVVDQVLKGGSGALRVIFEEGGDLDMSSGKGDLMIEVGISRHSSADVAAGGLQGESSLSVVEEGMEQTAQSAVEHPPYARPTHHEEPGSLQVDALPSQDHQEGNTEPALFQQLMSENAKAASATTQPLSGVAESASSDLALGIGHPNNPPLPHANLYTEHSFSMLPVTLSTLSSDISASSLPMHASESQATLVRKSIKEKLQGLTATNSNDPLHHHHSAPHRQQGPSSDIGSSRQAASITKSLLEAEGKLTSAFRRSSLAADKKPNPSRLPSHGTVMYII
jgi:hypothetical protein